MPGNGILEQRDLWGREGKDNKERTNQKDHGERQEWIFAWDLRLLKSPPLIEKNTAAAT